MKKLEQKHIAPYPLGDGGIKIITSLNQGTFITPITQIDFNESDLVYGNSYLDKDDGYYPYNLEAIHPILRPLSDLTKVIELADGKCLIPAEILYRIGCEGQTNPFNPKHCYVGKFKYKQFNEDGVDVLHIIPIDDKRHEILEITYGYGQVNFQRGLDREKDSTELYSCVEQIQLFQRLFEWHFDVFGLIQAGLARDINTLKNGK